MVYSWTDAKGVSHYTNKEYEIPAKYRAKVKARYPEAGDSSIPPQNVQASQARPNVQAQPQTKQANIPELPASALVGIPPELHQLKRERFARKARRSRAAEDE